MSASAYVINKKDDVLLSDAEYETIMEHFRDSMTYGVVSDSVIIAYWKEIARVNLELAYSRMLEFLMNGKYDKETITNEYLTHCSNLKAIPEVLSLGKSDSYENFVNGFRMKV